MISRVSSSRWRRWSSPSISRALGGSRHAIDRRASSLSQRTLSTRPPSERVDSFRALASTFSRIEACEAKNSRDASVQLLAAAYRPLLALPSPRSLASALSITAAKLAPAHRGVELRFGPKSFAQLLRQLEPEPTSPSGQRAEAGYGLKQAPPSIEQTLVHSPDYGSAVQELLLHDQIALGRLHEEGEGDRNATRNAGESTEQLTIEQLHDELLQIASVVGVGGVARKQQRALGLLRRCRSRDELVFLVRILAHQNLRIGLGDKSILAALAHATMPTDSITTDNSDAIAPGSAPGTKEWVECVTRAYAQLPDFTALADRLHANRFESLLDEKLKWLPAHAPPTPGVPVLAMSAYPVSSVSHVLRRASKSGSSGATFEFKYDGARVQLHFISKSDEGVTREAGEGARVFSRNMEDTTDKYGSLLNVLARQVIGDGPVSFIMEGEVVALDRTTGTFHPFQVLQAKETTEFCLFAFDLLALNGENLLDKPLRERRARLRELFVENPGHVELVKSIDMDLLDSSEEESASEPSPVETTVRDFLERAVTSGCEGLMVKTLDGSASSYRAGARSYSWMKLKQDYLSESAASAQESSTSSRASGGSKTRDTGAFLPDTLDLVPIGAFYGKGRRTGGFGSFLLATYNSSSGKFETIGKVGSGFSDAEMANVSARLELLATEAQTSRGSVPEEIVSNSIPSCHPDVWIAPTEVWEIKATQLTLSPSYTCGTGQLTKDSDEKRGKGLALRFPRFLRRRVDKSPDDATDSEQVVELFRQATAASQVPGASSSSS